MQLIQYRVLHLHFPKQKILTNTGCVVQISHFQLMEMLILVMATVINFVNTEV